MDKKTKLLHRLITLCLLLVFLCGIASAGLYSLQIINGEPYRLQAERHLTTTSVVSASRGEILDRYGRPLVTNESVYSIRFDYAYWDHENQNDILRQLVQLAVSAGVTVPTELPISQQEPYVFTCEKSEKAYKKMIDYIDERVGMELISLASYGVTKADELQPAQILEILQTYYKIGSHYAPGNARAILDQRYRMGIAQFSRYNPFIFLENVPMQLIAQIKERHDIFSGVNIEASTVRKYETDYAAQLIGRTDIIWEEEWDTYKQKGNYSKTDIVGKSGIERSMEEHLRGKKGSRLVDTDVSGEVTGTIEAAVPQPGDNVVLTIDIELQKVAEEALARVMRDIPNSRGAAMVVMDVNNFEVLAAANYPTYSPITYEAEKNDLIQDPLNPLYNRAFMSAYAPGSTYKPMIAIAGLEEGILQPDTKMVCNQFYDRFRSRRFKCLGLHHEIDLTQAIRKSCNIYFYETGYFLGGKGIEKWAKMFGFGQKTGIEVGEVAGSAAGPEHRAKMLENNPMLNKWQPGDVVQAAIGQSDNTMTPLQLCVYTATLANGGMRYKPTLIKDIKSYDYSNTVYEHKPELVLDLELEPENVALVQNAMVAVAEEGGTAAKTFKDYPIPLAVKTGTSQHGKTEDMGYNDTDHGTFIAFAPANDPKIAIAIVGECAAHGSDMAPAAKEVLDAYFQGEGAVETISQENALQP